MDFKPSAAQRSIRRARAALIISSLRSSLARNKSASAAADLLHSAPGEKREVLEMEKTTMVNLKVDLAKEREKMRKVRLCGVMEVLLQVMLLISVSSLVLILALDSFQ